MTDKITIERETVELAASLIQPLTGKGDREVYDVLRAALAAQPAPAAVPLGWKLVPLEPFPSQRIAGAVALMKASDSDLDCTTDEIAAAYRAMIAAAGDNT